MRLFSLLGSLYRNHRREVPRPSYCTYLVTYRCNARCGMCDSWRMKPGAELSPEAVGAVFRKLGRLDVVRLSGGEPFLRTDFAQVARAVWEASRPLVLHITTNGSFPERVEELVAGFPAPRRLAFMVSLDGMPAHHDANRGKDVTFERALDTLRRLAALRSRHGLAVSVNHTVISPGSLADSAAIKDTLRPLGIDVQSVLAYADSSMYSIKLRGHKASHLIVPRGYPVHPDLAGADVIGFVERELAGTAAIRNPALRLGKRYYLRGLLSRLREEESPSPRPDCVALRSHVRLLPDGRVPVCQFNTETVGNLADEPFEPLWRGAPASTARAWVDDCTGCWAECEVMPSAIYTGDLIGLPRLLRHLPRATPSPIPTP